MSKNDIKLFDQIKKKFISNPETFILYRGEGWKNMGGLHFTTDENWVKKFSIFCKRPAPDIHNC